MIRLVAAVSFRPALFFSDSWAYIYIAYRAFPVGFAPDRPSGYPLMIRLLAGPGRELEFVGVFQHLAGLASGAIVYVLLRRLDVRWWLALLAAAVPLFDGQTIALERHLLSESFFALLLLVSVSLAIAKPRNLAVVGASGVALGLSTLLRSAGLFAAPVWFIYLLVKRPGGRVLAVALSGFALPVLAYLAAHARAGLGPGMTQADGWFLYARVAPFADCAHIPLAEESRRLCPGPEHAGWFPSRFVWDTASPARRAFKELSTPGSNDALRKFGRRVIREQPVDYVRTVGNDLFQYILPGGRGFDETVTFPNGTGVAPLPDYAVVISRDYLRRQVHPTVSPTGRWIARYARLVRVNQIVVAFMFVTSLGVLLVGTVRRDRSLVRYAPEVLLTIGISVCLLILPAALVEQWTRFAVPVFPLLAVAAALSGEATGSTAAAVRQ